MPLTLPPLLHLMQLASPALPVGGYSYSQGLEAALERGVVDGPDSAARWIREMLHLNIGRWEAPIWLRIHRSWQENRGEELRYWNDLLLRSRESSEFRAETVQMGYSLVRLLRDAGGMEGAALARLEELAPATYTASFACAAAHFGIAPEEGLLGYLWSWLENQVTVAVKSLPLGQVAGQRMLNGIRETLPQLLERILRLPDERMGGAATALAIASCHHENQYCRLYRS